MIAEMIADDKAMVALWDEADGRTGGLVVKSKTMLMPDNELHFNALKVPSLEHAELLRRKINNETLS
jgi:hypothetical protein